MISFKQYLILIVVFAFSGCGPRIVTDQASDLVLNKEKALVVFSSSINSNEHHDEFNQAFLTWKSISDKNNSFPQSDLSFGDDNLRVYVVSPGTYSLEKIYSKRIERDFWRGTVEITSALDVKNFLGFSITGGDVVYLSHIEFKYEGYDLTYTLFDHYDYVYKKREKLFPKLYTKLKFINLNNLHVSKAFRE